MERNITLKDIKPLDIVLFHIGGTGGYGPCLDTVIKLFAPHFVVVCFEANSSENDELVQKQYAAWGVRTLLVPKCVGDIQGKQRFFVNKYRESSSLFPPSPQALQEHVMYVSMSKGSSIHTWGQNCELDHMEEVECVTLDSIIRDNMFPAPDFLSIDAQGAELRIMRGGERCIANNVLCVLSEVEFHEIYQGQALFCDQMNFLLLHGFRFTELYSKQYWHPAPSAGSGFLTVGEALFFRDVNKYCSKFQDPNPDVLLYRLMKLSALAYAYGRFSYSAKIVTLLLEKYGDKAKQLFLSSQSYKPVLEKQQYMQKNHSKYLKDFEFFYKDTLRNRLRRFYWAGRAFMTAILRAHDNIE